ncbi:helix-turn-helix domain-containing protein [Flavobacterium sp.]|uniref:helix-turn-helix domain-containing protein n=1 Tax=Flavobacterium sp. TaxID=239 RepID=UPI0039E55C6B
MKLLRILTLLLICSCTLWAQTDKITESILGISEQLIYRDVAKAEKQALFFTQDQENKANTVSAYLVLADAAYLKGQYAATMKNLYAADTIKLSSTELRFEIKKKLSFVRYYRLFGFEELSRKNSAEALRLLLDNQSQRNDLWFRYHLENALAAKTAADRLKALQQSEDLTDLSRKIHQTPLDAEMLLCYAAAFRQQRAVESFRKAVTAIGSRYSVFGARALLEQAQFDRAVGKSSLESLLQADALLDQHTDVPTQLQVAQLLAQDFLQKDEVASYKKYFDKHKMLNDQLNRSLKEVRDGIIMHLEAEKKAQSASGFNYYLLAAGLLLLLLSGGVYFYVKAKKDYRKFLAAVEKAQVPEQTAVRQMAIPQKTEEALLEKLAKFEKSNRFTNPNLTLVTLAKSLDTNTKYLSEIINKNKDANFNQYINELRINYIIGKMKEDPKYLNYKVYYLAKECGFSSQSTFSTVFRASTGISPLSFIKFLKNENKQVS